MLVVSHFEAGAPDFVARAHAAMTALAARPGYLRGQLGRSLDEPAHWCLVTEWESVGAYRRALSAYDVKLSASPLLAESMDLPSAFEVLGHTDDSGTIVEAPSDRAPDASR